jgi:alpha-tubulin suppressor-like RCC1 family protein
VGHVAQFQSVGASAWTDGPTVVDPASVILPGTNGVRYRYRVASTSASGDRSEWGSYCLIGWGDVFASNVPIRVGEGGALDGHAATHPVVGGSYEESTGHACATDETGKVLCWGNGLLGTLGDGTFSGAQVPVGPASPAVPTFAGVTDLVAGAGHNCALMSLGHVACWGSDYQGQVGFAWVPDPNSDTMRRVPTPVEVNGLTASHVFAGRFTSCAITTTGGLSCWGYVHTGEGLGGMIGHTATDVAIGENHICALIETGHVVCWGQNLTSSPPVEVDGGALNGKTVTSISADRSSTCAVTTEGRVACWVVGGTPTPIVEGVLAGVAVKQVVMGKALLAGQQHACALTAAGLVACWGDNSRGQRGIGNGPAGDGPSWVSQGRLAGGGLSEIESGDAALIGLWDGTMQPGSLPGMPIITSVQASGRTVTLAWTPPSSTGSGPIASYQIDASDDGGHTWTPISTTGPVSTAQIIVPTDGFWSFRLSAANGAGVSPPAISSEIKIVVDARTTKSNVAVTFRTPSGTPIVGATVKWKTTDGKLSSAFGVTTTASGVATFPVLATGSVGFALNGGSVGNTPIDLESASFTRIILRTNASYVIITPDAPAAISRTISVQMPDGSAVPDTALVISGGITGSVTSGPQQGQASWNYRGFTSALSSGATGQIVVHGFAAVSNGNDVTATFSDSIIQQVATASLIDPSVIVMFEQMPVVQVITPNVAPLDPGAAINITAVAVDGSGAPISAASLTLSLTATTKDLRTATLSASCVAKLSGKTNASGAVTFKVCPTATAKWRADGANIVASQPVLVAVKPAPTQVVAGRTHSCARVADATVRCWGANTNGQLGDGSTAQSTTPRTVVGLSKVTQVSVGDGFSCAIVLVGASRQVRCWGKNTNGQLGIGSVAAASTPRIVTTGGSTPLIAVTRVAAARNFACALLTAGTVRCWGANTSGQLGDGTTTQRTRPVPVKLKAGIALSGVKTVSVGGTSACAVMSTGAVRCWGANADGQLGNNSSVNARYPVVVSGLDGKQARATAVTVGDGFACARLSTGEARCWGRNSSGQLGSGTTTRSRVPVTVAVAAGVKLMHVTSLAAGGAHACAIIGSGAGATTRCWGANSSGQLGIGTKTSHRYATAVARSNGATSISCGAAHTLAVMPSTIRVPGISKAWGANSTGQLGVGGTVGRSTPTTLTKL